MPVTLGADRQAALEFRRFGAVILHPQQQKLLLGGQGQVDRPHGFFLNFQLALNGVVQGIAEYGADVHHIHEMEPATVGDHGQGNPVLLAVQAFAGQHRIQYGVAGFVLGFIAADICLHFIQPLVAHRGILLGAQGIDLMLQIVIFAVYQLHRVPAHPVLGVLVFQNGLHGIQLPLGIHMSPVLMVRKENRKAAQIREGADVHDLAGILTAEGGAMEIKTHIYNISATV